jgi:hypothetical protein
MRLWNLQEVWRRFLARDVKSHVTPGFITSKMF